MDRIAARALEHIRQLRRLGYDVVYRPSFEKAGAR